MTNAEWFDTGKLIVIRGSVYDSEGNPQAGILVSMFDTNNSLVKRVRTNSSGIFRLAFDRTTFVYGTYSVFYGFEGVIPRFKYDLNPGDYDTLMIWNFDSIVSGQAANPWNSTTRYLKGAVVSDNGSIYKCILDDPAIITLANVMVGGSNSSPTDSGASVSIRDTYSCTAKGFINVGGSWGTYGPDGNGKLGQGFFNPASNYMNQIAWSLVGIVGGTPFQLGSSKTFSPPKDGELYFIFNDNVYSDNVGSFSVQITTSPVPYPAPIIDPEHWQLAYQGQPQILGANPAVFYTIGSMP